MSMNNSVGTVSYGQYPHESQTQYLNRISAESGSTKDILTKDEKRQLSFSVWTFTIAIASVAYIVAVMF